MIIHDFTQESTPTVNQNLVPESISEEDWEITLPAWQKRSASDAFTALFPPNPEQHIFMKGYDRDSGIKETGTSNSPPTIKQITAHLTQSEFRGTIGYLPGWEQETIVGCVDIDNKGKAAEAFQAETEAIQNALKHHGVAFNLERSTNGGHHLWVFLTEPVPHAIIRNALKFITGQAGFPGVEVFPKGNALSNAIYLPYRGASAEGSGGLGRTFLERPDGTPIPLSRVLDEVRVTHAERIRLLATRMEAKASATPTPIPVRDLDPTGLSLLIEAAKNPPEGFQRHSSIEAFLNTAGRMGKQAEMAEALKSGAIFDTWVSDGSRTQASWEAEIDRWQTGKSEKQLGIKFLLEQGWQMPALPKLGVSAYSGRKLSSQEGIEALRAKYAVQTEGQRAVKRIQRYRAHEIHNLPQLEPLVGSLLINGTLAALLGPSGAGKSMVALDIALHVATRKQWQQREVKQGPVAWLAAESMEYTVERMEAWSNRQQVLLHDLPFDLLDGYLALTDVQPSGGLEELILELKDIEEERGSLRLIVVDTVARTFGDGDENSNDDMKHYTDAAELMTRIFNCTVLLIHHTGKEVSRGGRGASAFKAPLTTELTLDSAKDSKGKKSPGVVSLIQSKNRGAADSNVKINLQFTTHSWLEGDKSRSSGVVADAILPADVQTGADMLSGEKKRVYDLLVAMREEGSDWVFRAEWRDRFDEQGGNTKTFNFELNKLLADKLIERRKVGTREYFRPIPEVEDEQSE